MFTKQRQWKSKIQIGGESKSFKYMEMDVRTSFTALKRAEDLKTDDTNKEVITKVGKS